MCESAPRKMYVNTTEISKNIDTRWIEKNSVITSLNSTKGLVGTHVELHFRNYPIPAFLSSSVCMSSWTVLLLRTLIVFTMVTHYIVVQVI